MITDASNELSGLTVFIPSYNRSWALERILPGFLEQVSSSDLIQLGVEVIVALNPANDNSFQVLAHTKLKYPWITIVEHSKNIGFEGQLDYIGKVVRSNFLWILGDDDLVRGDLDQLAYSILHSEAAKLLPYAHVQSQEPKHITSLETLMNDYKGISQFISSWIVPSNIYKEWLTIARQNKLEDPHILVNMASVSLVGVDVIPGMCISPYPWNRSTKVQAPTLEDCIDIFWVRPWRALDILIRMNMVNRHGLSSYMAWEDRQLLRQLYIVARDNPSAAISKSMLYALRFGHHALTRIIFRLLAFVPASFMHFLAHVYSHIKTSVKGVVANLFFKTSVTH